MEKPRKVHPKFTDLTPAANTMLSYFVEVDATHEGKLYKKQEYIRTNRDNPEKLELAINQQRKRLFDLDEYPDELFKEQQLKKIERYKSELCPRWRDFGFKKQRELYEDLEAYRLKLIEMIPDETKPQKENVENELPEIELKTLVEQIRLLHDLGIIEHLKERYPNSLKSNNRLAHLVSQILKRKRSSVQPIINALISDNANKNYPQESSRTKAIIDSLNANESN